MDDQTRRHNITARIADVEPFKLLVAEDEEAFYRYIIEQPNKLWQKMRFGPGGVPSRLALAKVALYYAEMYYRKSALASEQSKELESFEAELDRIIREIGS